MKKTAVLILVLLLQSVSFSTIRYVSKSGSSTEPYTSWQTAADSIQKCIDFSQSGDTIYVANGTYKECIRFKPNIALIGSGMDSCIIDTKGLAIPQTRAIIIQDSCLIEGFTIDVHYTNQEYAGITADLCYERTIIRNNRIMNCSRGISLHRTDVLIQNNIIYNSGSDAIISGPVLYDAKPIIKNNYLSQCGYGVYIFFPHSPTILNNTIYMPLGQTAIFVIDTDTSLIANNLIISEANNGEGIYCGGDAYISNNVIVGKTKYGLLRVLPTNTVINNIIANGNKGVEFRFSSNSRYQYNNIWNCTLPSWGYPMDSTNYSVDPMFVNEDSLDFHLQMFSPMIDAGHPDVLDKDGSRSDLGLYGGPYGEEYKYSDLPPKIPQNIRTGVILDSSKIKFVWDYNTEADFNSYKIYKGYESGFTIDSSTYLTSVDTSAFIYKRKDTVSIFFKFTSLDNQGNESFESEELAILVTSVGDVKTTIEGYNKLFPNYPNPFNPSTKIAFNLKEYSRVNLRVYDIQGELIEELLNEWMNRGYHEVEFNAISGSGWKNKMSGLASGVYLFRIEVKNENNIPVFTDMRKSILLK